MLFCIPYIVNTYVLLGDNMIINEIFDEQYDLSILLEKLFKEYYFNEVSSS